MTPTDMEDAIRNLDSRLSRVEQILPTLATKADFADAKRHTSVLYESLRDDIRIVAEGVATIVGKVDVLTDKVEGLDRKVEGVDRKVEGLDRRIVRNDSALAALAARLQDVTVRLERRGVI